ncbi:CPXCG motif-containing cysteine-rich protein [Aurantivibrio infirmus]
MNIVEEKSIQCPSCGEQISLLVDCSQGDHSYTEDCEVCCRPLVVTVHLDGELINLDVITE